MEEHQEKVCKVVRRLGVGLIAGQICEKAEAERLAQQAPAFGQVLRVLLTQERFAEYTSDGRRQLFARHTYLAVHAA